MRGMGARVPVLAAWLVAASAGALADKDGPEEQGPPKKLKVIPQDIDRVELKKIMQGFSNALGVKCAYCHNPRDFASDEKKKKLVAREFVKMTVELEKTYFAYEGAPSMKYNCWVCHRGHDEPQLRPK
ncbi:MAG: c-type cytochrome [Deltaproteobacteria bacterium]|nr:c-type cytochrome [Deltaproteobacteria bacterium]